jgi:flagellar assembly protein FliH
MSSSYNDKQADKGKVALPSFEEMMAARRRRAAENGSARGGAGSNIIGDDNDGDSDTEALSPFEQEMRELEKKTRELCSSMRKSAIAESERLIDEANQEAANIRKRSHKEGFDSAYDDCKKELDRARESMLSAAKTLNDTRASMFAQIQDELVDTVMDMAEKILGYELENNPKAYEAILSAALERLGRQESIVLRIGAQGYDAIFGGDAPFMDQAALLDKNIKVIRDTAVRDGDCVATGENGTVSVGTSIQLERMREAIEVKKGKRA